jgi:hypothetical protein
MTLYAGRRRPRSTTTRSASGASPPARSHQQDPQHNGGPDLQAGSWRSRGGSGGGRSTWGCYEAHLCSSFQSKLFVQVKLMAIPPNSVTNRPCVPGKTGGSRRVGPAPRRDRRRPLERTEAQSPIESGRLPTCSRRARSRARRLASKAPGGSVHALALRCARRSREDAVDGAQGAIGGVSRLGLKPLNRI